MPRSYGQYTIVVHCKNLRSFESLASRLPTLPGVFDERCTCSHDKIQFHYNCDLDHNTDVVYRGKE